MDFKMAEKVQGAFASNAPGREHRNYLIIGIFQEMWASNLTF